MREEFISKFRGARIKKVLEIKIAEGDGTNTSPVREVTYLCEENGEVIARIDPEDLE